MRNHEKIMGFHYSNNSIKYRKKNLKNLFLSCRRFLPRGSTKRASRKCFQLQCHPSKEGPIPTPPRIRLLINLEDLAVHFDYVIKNIIARKNNIREKSKASKLTYFEAGSICILDRLTQSQEH